MKKILVCEDEDAIRDFVVINLVRAGYDVIEANCGEMALQKYEENDGKIDVAILDVMMPGMDGFQVCKELRRRNGGIGIIMLTARTQEMDKVTGLMLGADDYGVGRRVAAEYEMISRCLIVCAELCRALERHRYPDRISRGERLAYHSEYGGLFQNFGTRCEKRNAGGEGYFLRAGGKHDRRYDDC